MIQNVSLPFDIELIIGEEDGIASISSGLAIHFAEDGLVPGGRAVAAADAIESFLLAMAGAGIDMTDMRIADALATAVENIAENLDPEPAATVAVIVSGGMVENVIADGEIEVILVDHDIDGSDSDQVYSYTHDEGLEVFATGGIMPVTIDKSFITELHAEVNLH